MKSILKKLAGVVMVMTLVIGMIGCANDSGSNNNSNSKSNACCGFVKVTGGTITGSTSNRCWSGSYSGVFVNNRTVKLSSFIICDHEVTKAEYKAIMDNASLNTAGITAAPSYISNKPEGRA